MTAMDMAGCPPGLSTTGRTGVSSRSFAGGIA